MLKTAEQSSKKKTTNFWRIFGYYQHFRNPYYCDNYKKWFKKSQKIEKMHLKSCKLLKILYAAKTKISYKKIVYIKNTCWGPHMVGYRDLRYGLFDIWNYSTSIWRSDHLAHSISHKNLKYTVAFQLRMMM